MTVNDSVKNKIQLVQLSIYQNLATKRQSLIRSHSEVVKLNATVLFETN